jgi:hypothetical protein
MGGIMTACQMMFVAPAVPSSVQASSMEELPQFEVWNRFLLEEEPLLLEEADSLDRWLDLNA